MNHPKRSPSGCRASNWRPFFLLALLLPLTAHAADDKSVQAQRYVDCMNSAAEAWASKNAHFANRQDVAWMLTKAEQGACASQRSDYLRTYPIETRAVVDDASHRYFLDEITKNLGMY